METGPWQREASEPLRFHLKEPRRDGALADRLMPSGDLCARNLRQISLAMMMYVQDYDEKFPPASVWIDVLLPYVRTEDVFDCPEGNGEYGYAMNEKLSRLSLAEVRYPSATVMIYESKIRRRNHFGTGKDLDYRHYGGSWVAYCDSHCAWHPEQDKLHFQP